MQTSEHWNKMIYRTKVEWGLYQNKVTSSLTAIQKPGHQADNGKSCLLNVTEGALRQLANAFKLTYDSPSVFSFQTFLLGSRVALRRTSIPLREEWKCSLLLHGTRFFLSLISFYNIFVSRCLVAGLASGSILAIAVNFPGRLWYRYKSFLYRECCHRRHLEISNACDSRLKNRTFNCKLQRTLPDCVK